MRIMRNSRLGKEGRSLHVALVCGMITCFFAPTSWAITVNSTSDNTTVKLGLDFAEMEFENPVKPGTKTNGYTIKEWKDADYIADGNYDDWEVVANPSLGSINGNAHEVWMRDYGQSIKTTTSKRSTKVTIHLHGDDNDGRALVYVDGNQVADLDLWSSPADNAWILVDNLVWSTHTIRVTNADVENDDVATFGAAAVPALTTSGMMALIGLLLTATAWTLRWRQMAYSNPSPAWSWKASAHRV